MNEQNNLEQEILDLEKAIAAKLERPGQKCIIDQEIGVLAAKVVADCTAERKQMVIHILQLVGFNTTNLRVVEEKSMKRGERAAVGKMIDYARREYGIPVTKMAEKFGVSRPLLYKYINGDCAPSEKAAKAIIAKLNEYVPGIETEYRRKK